MNKAFPFRLYLVIAQENCLLDWLNVVEEAIKGGVDVIQLREKKLSNTAFLENAKALQGVTKRFGIPLIINDNISIAKTIKAEGIHVGVSDTPPTEVRTLYPDCQYVGYSIEHIEQLSNKEILVSDCLGVSPVFKTPTKIDTVTEWGLNGIRKIRTLTDKPLIAIGNMSVDNCYDVIKAGADCIAVVSAICGSDKPGIAAEKLRTQIEKAL